MPRHKFTKEEARRGGLTRKQQESYFDACSKGWEVTMERHPWFARLHLKAKIHADYPQGRVRKYDE